MPMSLNLQGANASTATATHYSLQAFTNMPMSLNLQGANASTATDTHLAYKPYQCANESGPPRSQYN